MFYYVFMLKTCSDEMSNIYYLPQNLHLVL